MNPKNNLPSFESLKSELPPITTWEKWSVVLIPLMTITAYFVFASLRWYVPALLTLVYLSFATYGSCCHDLVHGNIGISRRASNLWLSAIEFLMMRSGTTYRKTHLNHHLHYPDFEKDPEGRASYFSLFRTLLEGPVFHPKLIFWMLKHGNRRDKMIVSLESLAIVVFYSLGIFWLEKFPALFFYQLTVTLGAWVIPLITSYLVHLPQGEGEIRQTRIFRGRFFRILAMDHLYHLEHHLYPMVPHCRWKKLALMLNPYFERENLTAVRLESSESRNFSLD